MESNKDIRWKQRFQNFNLSFILLENSLAIDSPNVTERAGIIQFYEITFELAWKILKDYLEEEGFNVKSPREVIKLAFQNEIISNGHSWLEALDNRNITTHTYDETTALSVELQIRQTYFPLLKNLRQWLSQR